jgi:hypothetical protein
VLFSDRWDRHSGCNGSVRVAGLASQAPDPAYVYRVCKLNVVVQVPGPFDREGIPAVPGT